MNIHKNKMTLSLGILLLFFFLGAGCKRQSEGKATTLRIALGSEPPTLDPALADTGVSVFVLRQVSSTLFEYDSRQNFVHADAQSHEWSEAGKRLTIVLRPNLKWSDGVTLTPCHFRDALVRVLDPKIPSTMAELFFDIEGAIQFKAAKFTESQLGIECNQQEISFRVQMPYSLKLMHGLAFVVSAPFRRDLLEKRGANGLLPQGQALGVSSGAYIISEWQHDRKIILKSRVSQGELNLAPERQAKIASIELPIVRDSTTAFALYESGALDVLEEVPPALISKIISRSDRVLAPSPTTYMVGFSLKSNPVLQDKRVRQALALCAGQNEIPTLLKGGERGAKGWIYPDLLPPAFRPTTDLYDVELAKKLFSEAGYGNNRKKFPVLKLFYNSGERHQLLMERLSYRWKETLGIQVELNPLEWKVLVAQLKTHPPDLYRYAWTAVYPDPLFFLELFKSDSLNNFGSWKNLHYDRLIEDLQRIEPAKRNDDYFKKIEKAQHILLREDPALIPIYHYVKNALIKPYVKNFSYDMSGARPLRFVEIRDP